MESSIILLYFWLHNDNYKSTYMNLEIFTLFLFFSNLASWKPPKNQFFFDLFKISGFAFWRFKKRYFTGILVSIASKNHRAAAPQLTTALLSADYSTSGLRLFVRSFAARNCVFLHHCGSQSQRIWNNRGCFCCVWGLVCCGRWR